MILLLSTLRQFQSCIPAQSQYYQRGYYWLSVGLLQDVAGSLAQVLCEMSMQFVHSAFLAFCPYIPVLAVPCSLTRLASSRLQVLGIRATLGGVRAGQGGERG